MEKSKLIIPLFLFLSAISSKLSTINPVFAQDNASQPHDLSPIETLGGYQPSLDIPGLASILETVMTNLLGVFTLVGGIMFILYFVLGALGWITAEGQSDKIEVAKNQMTNAAVGLVILVAAYAIIYVLSQVLGLDIINVGEQIEKILKD